MNKQIEQLLEQARAECFRFGSKPATTVGYDELEKFAELIVRECAEQVDWILAEGGKTQGDLIKEHFGVEDPPVDNVDRILRTVRTRGVQS